MKEQYGYCQWYGCTMNQITEDEQEDCDYCNGNCKYCDKYDKDQYGEVNNDRSDRVFTQGKGNMFK